MKNFKSIMRKYIELFSLYKKHWRSYGKYYTSQKATLYKIFKSRGITNIKPTGKSDWKIWYGTCYFKGEMNNEVVFIKVQGSNLLDCFENERKLNLYIDQTSQFLAQRKPQLYLDFIVDDFYVFVFKHIRIDRVRSDNSLVESVQMALNEYSRIGLLHSDFGLVNIGNCDGNVCFFDYGTSIFPDSDKVRVRNSPTYNHLEKILPQAKSLINEPDFYYDDAVHCGLDGLNRENVNFLVGKNDLYYARLGKKIYKYHLENKSEHSVVKLLCKDAEFDF